MKKLCVIISIVLLATGCGALRISPRGCRTDAVWGTSPLALRDGKTVHEDVIDVKAKDTFYVFSDLDLKLSELLESNGIKCSEVKSVRVIVNTSWFFMRDVSLKVVKK